MLPLRLRALQTLCAHCRGLKTTAPVSIAAPDVKPFHYQDVFEQEKKPDVQWKKLTSLYDF